VKDLLVPFLVAVGQKLNIVGQKGPGAWHLQHRQGQCRLPFGREKGNQRALAQVLGQPGEIVQVGAGHQGHAVQPLGLLKLLQRPNPRCIYSL